MNLFDSIKTPVEQFINDALTSLSNFFQDINLDNTLSFFCKYHLLICALVFIGFVIYFVAFDKKRSYLEFTEHVNIAVFVVCIPLYSFLSDKSISLDFIGLISVPVHSFILIVLAKYYGPLFTGAFGGLEYLLTYLNSSGTPLMFSVFFVYAIGGFIHGLILYEQKTAFWRCLLARFGAILLCNVILLSFVQSGTLKMPLNLFLSDAILSGLIQLPVQAVIGYVSLLLVKPIKERLEFQR
ncbi:MAG: hypothetical protein E7415_07205 [Ruminococcaceae bacterium]|nr:hypothetical protein [Oscillospiraceae bacterium]